MRVALLFTDGVGVGPRDPVVNPLARGAFLQSQFLDGSGERLDDGLRFDLDATFGLPGRPQSATNQVSLLTGEAAPLVLGRHLAGYPNEALRQLVATRSLPRRVREAGRTISLTNAYPLAWLDALGLPHRGSTDGVPALPERFRRRLRPSASALAFSAAGTDFRTFSGAQTGDGLLQDVDGRHAARRGWTVPTRTPEEAARVFWRLAGDFTLFEHFLSDEAGHAQDAAAAMDAISTFDQFARAVIASRPSDTVVLVTSDHGNVEDSSSRQHTRHPVALLAFGAERDAFRGVGTLAEVGARIATVLGAER